MSLHSPAKRLAVLIAIYEQDFSLREAAKLHGVDRNSAHAWTQAHRQGKLTLDELRKRGVVPTPAEVPQLEAVVPRRRADFISARPNAVVHDVEQWRLRGEALKKELLDEREKLSVRLVELDKALAALNVEWDI